MTTLEVGKALGWKPDYIDNGWWFGPHEKVTWVPDKIAEPILESIKANYHKIGEVDILQPS